jgi:putative flavoprotein involved in K+ transport
VSLSRTWNMSLQALARAGVTLAGRLVAAHPWVWYVGLRWLTHRASGNFLGFPTDAAATADAVATHLRGR